MPSDAPMSFDDAIAKVDVDPYVTEHGWRYPILGLDAVRAAHRAEVERAVREAVEQEREACAKYAHNGSVVAFEQMAAYPGKAASTHTLWDVWESIGKALAECEAQIRARGAKS